MEELKGKEVVIDTDTSYIYVGILVDIRDDCFVMEKGDVHDRNDLQMSKEKYILETRRFGVKENRKRTYILKERVVSISILEDVLEF